MNPRLVRGLCGVGLVLAMGVGAAEEGAAAKDDKVALELCPMGVQTALKKAAAEGTLKKVRKVRVGEKTAYVGTIDVAFDRDGNLVTPAAMAEASAAAASAADALTKPVSLNVTGAQLRDVCVELSTASGVPVSCGNAFATKLVTASFKDTPLGDVLKAIAEQTGTRTEAREGGYRFRAGPKPQ